jgi:hypothetical protein
MAVIVIVWFLLIVVVAVEVKDAVLMVLEVLASPFLWMN